ncbi:MAG: M20 family metallo-hydrolase [Deltaproteobacteria bacterium]|nr:M20 family metallo-hydrolase [Deltaproteobacteria bacterium]MBW2691132.1 M20 family metallo-hydrolase [Deltaproteobacteria bacterium]
MTTQINSARLWNDIHESGKIGATEKGGLCRLALSDEDRRVREWFVEACRAEGCEVRFDEVGNLFARRPGRRSDLHPIAIGSHLDSQPTGGKFDGILGVLAGLEAVRTLNEHGIETEHPIEIIDWTNEEGARFAPAMQGSGVFAGALEKETVLSCRDREGLVFGEELDRIGFRGEEICGDHPLDSYFELHIEQGPILENDKKVIGVVVGVQGMRWYDLTLEGSASHAGTTPMKLRRDASVAAAEIITAVNRLAEEIGEGALATTGVIDAYPNSRNVVPSRVFMTVDLRHTEVEVLDRMEERLKEIVSTMGSQHQVSEKLDRLWDSPPVKFDAECVGVVRESAKQSGHPLREITSGAGHDAVYVSRVAPTAMIFIPCKDGISHNEIESASREHVGAGTSVLLEAIRLRDRRWG